ncbi:hypothetical protein JNUCC1_01398 [Lentibacillus sp. JNUCC-1]|uniref:HAAS domain-containing protein n=1 Tax=Lentibacillus sp. JNUCC-1 TaxID=2654513 RepID=UPI001324D698|nr:DUF1700 domain-containing protein [Lentibacillus sp. JNUCC-1]MUV37592.1 hypothetical protein [Lentibacillus sp. JNUCC-1]
MAAGWITGVSFTGSPLLVILNAVLQPETFIWFDVFFSLVLAGIGVLIIVGMYYLTRVVAKGFIRYLRFNMNMVKGGMERA